jgi:CubicO group peptidase (beta-lactamase class C family)
MYEALDAAFSEPGPLRLRRTRAVVVVYNGRIIAERYAPGFSRYTPLIGWSMTKSVINALIGILVKEGRLKLQDRTLIPEWREPGDPRGDITLDQLLRMSSGLTFNEDYTNPLKDVIYMLLGTGDMAAYAAKKPLQTKPGCKWEYSSGTTNILARILRDRLSDRAFDHLTFPRRALFDPLSMSSAVMEPDASGTFVGSSFMYASARDWARFGLLYLNDGVWAGERILPEGWVAYSRTPTTLSPHGEYGAHFWLDIPSYYKTGESRGISLPSDAFHAAGHEGQFITIIPSRKLVVVRLGLTRLKGAWDQKLFIGKILEAIPQ